MINRFLPSVMYCEDSVFIIGGSRKCHIENVRWALFLLVLQRQGVNKLGVWFKRHYKQ